MDLRGEGDETQHLKRITIIPLSWTISPFQKKKKKKRKRCLGECLKRNEWLGDEATGSLGLRGLFEDYEGVYIQSWGPGAMNSGIWRLLDPCCIPIKSDRQLEFTNTLETLVDKWNTCGVKKQRYNNFSSLSPNVIVTHHFIISHLMVQ